MLRLHLVDWGYPDLPRGFFELHGRTVYGRWVGDKPHHYWSVASLAPPTAAGEGWQRRGSASASAAHPAARGLHVPRVL